jgi:hypothetical protein
MFITEREIKQLQCTLHFPVAINSVNRKLSSSDGYDHSFCCYHLCGVSGKGLGSLLLQNSCGREASNWRPLARLVSAYCVSNHEYARTDGISSFVPDNW